MRILELAVDHRKKIRFPMRRDVRYKVLEDGATVESGMGVTLNVASGGVAFLIENTLPEGAFIELSISWPVLLEGSCPMRLIVFGRVVRSKGRLAACTADRYEFRTQARAMQSVPIVRTDSRLEKWVDSIRKESLKAVSA